MSFEFSDAFEPCLFLCMDYPPALLLTSLPEDRIYTGESRLLGDLN